MEQKVPVALIDPAILFREGLKRIISDSSFEVRLVTQTLNEAKKDLEQLQHIRLVLVDPGADPDRVEANLREVREAFPAARVIVLTDTYCADHLVRSFRAGVDGYLLKSIASDVLIESLRLVLLGENVFPSQVASLIADGPTPSPARAVDVSRLGKSLSNRELQILRCLVDGDSNKVIARRLDVTEATVKVHIKTILRKIRVDNRTQAAIWALHRGLDGEIRAPGRMAGTGSAATLPSVARGDA